MYLMLSGKQPFEGKDDEEIENNIKQGKIDFNDPVWDYISNDAKDLIKKLLNIKVDKRYTAKQVKIGFKSIKINSQKLSKI